MACEWVALPPSAVFSTGGLGFWHALVLSGSFQVECARGSCAGCMRRGPRRAGIAARNLWGRSMNDQLTRRRLLEVPYACAVLAASGAVPALAQVTRPAPLSSENCLSVIPRKSSKEAAEHKEGRRSGTTCSRCRFFVAPDQCLVVEGSTTPESSCALWAEAGGKTNCPNVQPPADHPTRPPTNGR